MPHVTAPTTLEVVPLEDGGLEVTMSVTTYEGVANFTLRAERDADGDWRVWIPWRSENTDEAFILANGCEAFNGIVYLGGPEAAPAGLESPNTCEGCSDCEIPGVRWPTAAADDDSRFWVERCDLCERYNTDAEAASAVVVAHPELQFSLARPAGSITPTPYTHQREER